MLCGVSCLLFAVCRVVLFVSVSCVLALGDCLLFVGCRLLFADCCFFSIVDCVVVCCLGLALCCLSCVWVVFCLLFVV